MIQVRGRGRGGVRHRLVLEGGVGGCRTQVRIGGRGVWDTGSNRGRVV